MLTPCDLKEAIMLSSAIVLGLIKQDPAEQQVHDIRILEVFSPYLSHPTYAVSLNGANPGVTQLINCASREDAFNLFDWLKKCTTIEQESNPPIRREHFGVF